MNIENRVSELKEEMLKKIKMAVDQNDTDTIIKYSNNLKELSRIEEKLNEIKNALEHLKIFQDGNFFKPIQDNSTDTRQRGSSAREAFAKELENYGIRLYQHKGSIYKTINGHLIGIAYASENKNRKNHWFLGLPPENYKTIVFICQNKQGDLFNFILSPDFFTECKPFFSTDSNLEQYKFNVVFKSNEYLTIIPSKGKIPITNFLNNYVTLKNL